MLRSLCSHILPSGKLEVLVSEFSSWASVNENQAMQFDWDDAIGNASRRAAGLKLEAYRYKLKPWLTWHHPLRSVLCRGLRQLTVICMNFVVT